MYGKSGIGLATAYHALAPHIIIYSLYYLYIYDMFRVYGVIQVITSEIGLWY